MKHQITVPQRMKFSLSRIKYLGQGVVAFPVYAPNFITVWPTFQHRVWWAPLFFVWWLIKGLRYKLGIPALGRAVTLADMLRAHPGKPKQCLCRGEGTITSYRTGANGEQVAGVQFCAKMEEHFVQTCRPALFISKNGPRWLRGCAPEEMVASR